MNFSHFPRGEARNCLENYDSVQERLENLINYYFIACKNRHGTGRILENNLVNYLFYGRTGKNWIGAVTKAFSVPYSKISILNDR